MIDYDRAQKLWEFERAHGPNHRSLSAEFVKEYSYAQLAVLLVGAYAAALWKLPRMLRRRREISRSRKLTIGEGYGLLTRYKLDAIEIALKY